MSLAVPRAGRPQIAVGLDEALTPDYKKHMFHLIYLQVVEYAKDRVVCPDMAGNCRPARRPAVPHLAGGGRPDRAWSYAEFDTLVAAASGSLARAGVGAGDRVHLVHPNGPAFVLTWLAASRLGAMMVAADPRATAPNWRPRSDLTEPTAAVVTEANAQVYERCRGLANRPRAPVISCDPAATALGPEGGAGPAERAADGACRPAVHLGHDQRAEGGRRHPGQLQPGGRRHGRRRQRHR